MIRGTSNIGLLLLVKFRSVGVDEAGDRVDWFTPEW